ncbi:MULTISPECIES: helix-turn-helix transcriptional regulator [Cupriavidus]
MQIHSNCRTNANSAAAGGPLWRLSTVTAKTGLSRSEIYRRIARNAFPPGVRLGVRSRAWRAAEVEAWIAALPVAE